jgi:hypothetical protein
MIRKENATAKAAKSVKINKKIGKFHSFCQKPAAMAFGCYKIRRVVSPTVVACSGLSEINSKNLRPTIPRLLNDKTTPPRQNSATLNLPTPAWA